MSDSTALELKCYYSRIFIIIRTLYNLKKKLKWSIEKNTFWISFFKFIEQSESGPGFLSKFYGLDLILPLKFNFFSKKFASLACLYLMIRFLSLRNRCEGYFNIFPDFFNGEVRGCFQNQRFVLFGERLVSTRSLLSKIAPYSRAHVLSP